MVLSLLSKLKHQLKQRLFPSLGAIRDRVISSIESRYSRLVFLSHIFSNHLIFSSSGHLFDVSLNDSYTIAAITHPFLKN